MRQAVERDHTSEDSSTLDDDRARLLAVSPSATREGDQREENQSLELEVQRIAEALATREAELGDALRRADAAEVDAASGAGALRTAVEERDEWREEAVRLSAAMSEHEESIAHWTGRYEHLSSEAQRLAAVVADTETELADAQRRLDAATADVGDLREALADTLARLEAGELEASARE